MATDSTAAAREWIAANPDHEAAVHVRRALESADANNRLAVEMERATGHHVVIATVGTTSGVTLTSPNPIEEQRVADFIGRYLVLIETVRIGMTRERAEAALDACDRGEQVIREWEANNEPKENDDAR